MKTLALVQLQICKKDINFTRLSETKNRVMIHAKGHELILDKDTVAMLQRLFKKRS